MTAHKARERALAAPALVALAAFACAAFASFLMEDAYRELNREDPDADGARLRLVVCAAVSALGLAAGGFLLGRGAPWMALAGAAGLVLCFDRLEEAWSRWGMNWEDGIILWPAVWACGALVALALVGVRRRLGPAVASKAAVHAAALVLVPLLLFALALLGDLAQLERTADEQWTSEHADPPPAFWAVALAVLGAVAWARRRR